MFFAAPSLEHVDSEVRAIVGCSKAEAIEKFLDIANKRQLSLDDLMQDVALIEASGLKVAAWGAVCLCFSGAACHYFSGWVCLCFSGSACLCFSGWVCLCSSGAACHCFRGSLCLCLWFSL